MKNSIVLIALFLAAIISSPAYLENKKIDISWISADSEDQKSFDFSKVPGTPIAHSPSTSKIYLGSPYICMLDDGTYIASHDLFGKWNYKEGAVTRIYESKDKGETWKHISDVYGQGWSILMPHKGELYLLGNGAGIAGFVVRKSSDGGRTWTEPKDENTGIIIKESCTSDPMPVCKAYGRIFIPQTGGGAMPFKPKGWAHQNSFVMSVPEDADLLKASNWTRSNSVYIPEEMACLAHVGWLEGNIVLNRETGKIFNLLRTHGITDELASRYEISQDGKTATLTPFSMFFRMPGACKKFYIQYDEKSGMYYALSNWTMERDRGAVKNCPHPIKAERTRNTLALSRSKNLEDWEMYSIILNAPDLEHDGFQYPSFIIDGDDIAFVSRTAYFDGESKADNQHNSNFITFHKIKDFRNRNLNSKPLCGKLR